jgi:hypothetical protein
MKLVLGVILFFWLVSGVAGAWRLDELDRYHWKAIARGPMTLATALNEHPVTYGPN